MTLANRNPQFNRLLVLSLFACLAGLSPAAGSPAEAGPELRLIEAVRGKDRNAAIALLKQKADVNAASADGATALAWAAHWDDLELADLLIRGGANVNAANVHGVTSLALACENGSAGMVEKLLNAGSNANARLVKTGVTPLMTCSRSGNADAVKLLLRHGADVNAKESRRGQNALMWAVANKHDSIAGALIEHHADFRARSKGGMPAQYGSLTRETGFTPLLFAARAGHLDSAKILLDAGANVNEATPEDGNALVIAAAGGHEALALFLLGRGADPKAADAFGVSALHYAVRRGILELTGFEFYAERLPPPNMHELARTLLARGADPNAQIRANFPSNSRYHEGQLLSLVGATPLLLAAHTADTALLRIFLDRGADPKLATKAGDVPLLLAAGLVRDPSLATAEQNAQALESVKLLTQRGVELNHANGRGQTALHAAAGMGADALIQFLVEQGADVNVKNKSGETPWSIAMAMCPAEGTTNACGAYVIRKETAELLRKLGAQPGAPAPMQEYFQQ
ncbi:MAG: hypothetical protein EXQ56_10520 [Acidobacteria bacterium]|nr:hypothetical protein [Acidobacteriota bacterium]